MIPIAVSEPKALLMAWNSALEYVGVLAGETITFASASISTQPPIQTVLSGPAFTTTSGFLTITVTSSVHDSTPLDMFTV